MLKFVKHFTALLSLILVLFFSFSSPIQPAQAAALKDLDQCADYAKSSVSRLAQSGVITGDQNGYFTPRQTITRGQMITLLVKSLALDKSTTPARTDSFTDVPKNHWANKYVEIAYEKGITRGVGAGQFGVNQSCTREQMITLYVNSLKLLDPELGTIPSGLVDLNKFTDAGKISSWARDPVAFAVYMGLISGTSATTMDPAIAAERQQVAVLTDRYVSRQNNIINDLRAQRILGKSLTEQLNDEGISQTGDMEITLELQDADIPELNFKAHMVNEILWPDKIHQYMKLEAVDLTSEVFPTMEMENFLVDGMMYQNIPDENNQVDWVRIPEGDAPDAAELVQAIKEAQTAQLLLPDEIHKSAEVKLEEAQVNGTDGYKITYTGQITDLAGLLAKLIPAAPEGINSNEWTDFLDQIKENVKAIQFSETFLVGADQLIYNSQYTITITAQDANDASVIPLKSATISGSVDYRYNGFQITVPPEAQAAQ